MSLMLHKIKSNKMARCLASIVLILLGLDCSCQVVTTKHIGISDKPICTLRFSPIALSHQEECEVIVSISEKCYVGLIKYIENSAVLDDSALHRIAFGSFEISIDEGRKRSFATRIFDRTKSLKYFKALMSVINREDCPEIVEKIGLLVDRLK